MASGLVVVLFALGAVWAATPTDSPAATSAPWWLQAIGTVVGSLLVIYGLFTVPTDQTRYENYLVRWWVWVEERRERGLKLQAAFLQVVATVTASGLDRLFGHRLLSFRAVLASITLSFSSVFIVIGGTMFFGTVSGSSAHLVYWALIACGLFGLLLLWMVARAQVKAMIVVDAVLLAVTAGVFFVGFVRVGPERVGVLQAFLPLVVALLASLSSDIFFVAATRWLLRFSQSGTTVLRIGTLTILNLAAAAILVGAPFQLFQGLNSTAFVDGRWSAATSLAEAFVFVAFFNLLDGAVALCAITLGALMLVHRAIWPLIGRPLEVISSEHVLLRRWPLFFAGVGVLSVTWPGFDLIGRYLGLHR